MPKDDLSNLQGIPVDTWIQTVEGPRQISDLLNQPFRAVVNGKSYQSSPFKQTGYREVFEIQTKEGYSFKATAGHPTLVDHMGIVKKRTPVSDLQIGDTVCLNNHPQLDWEGEGTYDEGYVLGWLTGDGTIGVNKRTQNNSICPKLYFCGEKDHGPLQKISGTLDSCNIGQQQSDISYIVGKQLTNLCHKFGLDTKEITPEITVANTDFYCGFLEAFIDADGHYHMEHKSVELSQSDLLMLKDVQRMFLRLGITPNIRKIRSAGKRFIDGHTKISTIKASYVLQITNHTNLKRLSNLFGNLKLKTMLKFYAKLSKEVREVKYTARISAITPQEKQTVFNCKVDEIHAYDANGFIVHTTT